MITRPGNIQAQLRDKANNDIWDLVGAGAPSNGSSGSGVTFAGPGSTYFDTTNRALYVQVGTAASPFWQSFSNGVGLFTRQRFTAAQINAGATLLAAIPGMAYRMADAAMIAIGGAAAGATTVDILATLSSARKLMASAVAGLTQSAVLRAGATNGAVLADGASFTVNDANTAVTVGKTGGSLITATHIDVLFWYQIEKA